MVPGTKRASSIESSELNDRQSPDLLTGVMRGSKRSVASSKEKPQPRQADTVPGFLSHSEDTSLAADFSKSKSENRMRLMRMVANADPPGGIN
jgi:hypothetical protein